MVLNYKFIMFTLLCLFSICLVSITNVPTRDLSVIKDSDYYDTVKPEEHRKPVAIIDTGLQFELEEFDPYLCKGGHKDFTGEGLEDKLGHGTNVAWNVMKDLDPSKYCLIVIKWFTKNISSSETEINTVKAFKWAEKQSPVLINFSGGGYMPILSEKEVIESILNNSQSLIIVAAGNGSKDLKKECDYYPACYFSSVY